MFETLTRAEAEELMRILTRGYWSSREFAQDCSAWARATADTELRRSYYRDANRQAEIRSENTALRWQIRREAFGTIQPIRGTK